MQTSPNILFKEHTATHWANIILPLALPTIYTYTIPTHFLPKMQIGCRVEVELKNKKYSGLIKSTLAMDSTILYVYRRGSYGCSTTH